MLFLLDRTWFNVTYFFVEIGFRYFTWSLFKQLNDKTNFITVFDILNINVSQRALSFITYVVLFFEILG